MFSKGLFLKIIKSWDYVIKTESIASEYKKFSIEKLAVYSSTAFVAAQEIKLYTETPMHHQHSINSLPNKKILDQSE